MGSVVLPTVVAYSRILARLAIGLDKRPELVAHLTQRESIAGSGAETAERVTLVEGSANVIREGFKKCLSERSGNTITGLDAHGRPEGRRVGIYLCANVCLKLFFHCRKLRSAEQIFGNIYQQSPPLSRFPAAQRVTFLFYLGRYLFANNHFARALLALQAAYDQCHARCRAQRRTILIYLIPANIIMGRFPSAQLFDREEAAGLSDRFLPLCTAIRRGDMASFRALLDIDAIDHDEHTAWFLRRRILLPLRNRCEVLVWRSLARQTFRVAGFVGDGTRKAPSFELDDLLVLVRFLERKAVLSKYQRLGRNSNAQMTPYVDVDLAGEVASDGSSTALTTTPATSTTTTTTAIEGPEHSIADVEAAVASLINQNLLHGYLSHKFLRFIVTGAKNRSPLEVGFPSVWDTLAATALANTEVPGWVRDEPTAAARESGGAGPAVGAAGVRARAGGMVVNLKGARPVGAAPA